MRLRETPSYREDGISRAAPLDSHVPAAEWPGRRNGVGACTNHLVMTKIQLVTQQRLKHLPAMWETWVWSLGWEDLLEKEMAIHSSILAWTIPWTEEPGGSTGSQRVGHDWATSLSRYRRNLVQEMLSCPEIKLEIQKCNHNPLVAFFLQKTPFLSSSSLKIFLWHTHLHDFPCRNISDRVEKARETQAPVKALGFPWCVILSQPPNFSAPQFS